MPVIIGAMKAPFYRRLTLLCFLLAVSGSAQAYIGPGAGFAVAGSFLAVFLSLLAGLLAVFTWPLRWLIRAVRHRRAFARSRIKKCVILGLDGMDPKLAEKWMDEGKLPALDSLRRQGTFMPLATTIPSMSPVAWSSFQTGVNPGKHNIFDFLTRDKKTYAPKLSSVDIRGPRRALKVGKFRLPLGKPDIRLLRKSKPFWITLGENGIFSCILRVPITFPPEKFYGLSLSGMCVPDLRGSQGTFSLFSDQTPETGDPTGGQYHPVRRTGRTVTGKLIGPDDPCQADSKPLTTRFTVTVRSESKAVLKIGSQKVPLHIGRYTDWIRISFRTGWGSKLNGICKFLLQSIEPDFRLYVTPINIDPENPVMPISHPPVYSTYLSKRQGPYATLGLAEDSWALNERVLPDDGFIQQCLQLDAERETMFFDSLEKVSRGLCVCVFDGTDRLQHTFWRDVDPDHPAHEPSANGRNVIEELYQRMDRLAAKTIEKCRGRDTLLMVISDHGFSTFRYGVDLNRWLEENGYLVLKNGARCGKYLTTIDWSQTRAFAIGLSGIYLNLKNRESQGIVNPDGEADTLRREIAEKLTSLADFRHQNAPAIKSVYNSLELYSGPYRQNAPDLLVGYCPGYRASWETAVGQVTQEVFHENTKAWSGDHCIDASFVPGVLFSNRTIETDHPRLMDIGPTVLKLFGVDIPSYMDGKPLIVKAGKEERA